MAETQPTREVAPAATVKGTGGRKTAKDRNTRTQGPPRKSAANSARLIQDCVLASRNGGGGNVRVEHPDGTKVTIEVKQSRDSEPPLVEQTRNLRLQDVAVQQLRQQRWIDQQPAAQAPPPSPPPERAKTRKRREKRQQDKAVLKELKLRSAGLVMYDGGGYEGWGDFDPFVSQHSKQLKSLNETLPLSAIEHVTLSSGVESHAMPMRICRRC